MPTPALSVLLATRNRASRLPRVLRDLERARLAASASVEIVVADNGSSDATAAVLDEWCAQDAAHVRVVVGEQGKSRALNGALKVARGALLAFTDDDVEIPADWLSAVLAFFAAHPVYDGDMGRVAVPPHVTDPDVLARVARFRGAVPLYDMGNKVCDVTDMYGCNMVVRRSAFDHVGPFNADLGPGASGLSEDIELARRIRQGHMRIGYMPDAVIYHEVDPSRLTPSYYHEFQIRLGRSYFEMDEKASHWRSARRLLESAAAAAWWSLLGVSERRTRAWGRVIRHADLVRWGWRRRRERRTPMQVGGGNRSA